MHRRSLVILVPLLGLGAGCVLPIADVLALLGNMEPEPQVTPFEPPPNRIPNALLSGSWRLRSFGTVGGEVTPVVDDELYRLVFNSDSTLSGRADCNGCPGVFNARDDGSISIGLFCTEVACGSVTDYQEIIRTAHRFEIEGTTLRIIGGDRDRGVEMVLVYEAE